MLQRLAAQRGGGDRAGGWAAALWGGAAVAPPCGWQAWLQHAEQAGMRL